MNELYSLTPRQWHNMMKGYNHRFLDNREESANSAIMFAMANNGKSLNRVLRDIKEQRIKIDLTEEQLAKRKAEQEHIKKVQRMQLSEWAKNLAKGGFMVE